MERISFGFGTSCVTLILIKMYIILSHAEANDANPLILEDPTINQNEDMSHYEPVNYRAAMAKIEKVLMQNREVLERLQNISSIKQDFKQNEENYELVNPEKGQAHRRSGTKPQASTKNIALRMGKVIPKYARLIQDIFMNEVGDIADPNLVEYEDTIEERSEDEEVEIENDEVDEPSLHTRRSGNGVEPDSKVHDRDMSLWCQKATRCTRSFIPICGYDDIFGFGKFDDVCHMLHVNCNWKYNFVLVPSCRMN